MFNKPLIINLKHLNIFPVLKGKMRQSIVSNNIKPEIGVVSKLNFDYAKALWSEYTPQCRPRDWVFKKLQDGSLLQYFSSATVYFNKNTTIDEAKFLASERQATNIGMKRYSSGHLVSEGGYSKVQKNIGIYCESSANVGDIFIKRVRVINVIAPATDAYSQPDYQRLLKTQPHLRQLLYETMLEEAFYITSACAVQQKVKVLVMAGIGQGAFSNGAWELNINPNFAYTNLAKKYFGHQFTKTTGIKVIFANCDFLPEHNFHCVSQWLDSMLVSYSKGNDIQGLNENIEDVLFVNAWDPWSVIGNGNDGDNSLDGFWGRYSAMSMIGHPKINLAMNYLQV
jgi:hypothetical protein